ncbi:DMT family transporter [Pseudomonadota bacterium]
MAVPAAYIGVILIWTTTPLAIQWSGGEPGFLFGITGRIVLSAILALVLIHLLRLPIQWDAKARQGYLASGLGIFCSMLPIYWAAQYIPSGWISVLFGLAPIMTGIMAPFWLNEKPLSLTQLSGTLLGFLGLIVIFGGNTEMGNNVAYGIGAILFSVFCYAASGIWIKRIGSPVSGLVMTTGGLSVAAPLFLLAWFLSGNTWPEAIAARTAGAIIYLAVIGSLLGFALYYYLLRSMDVTRVALITLITPVSALLLGAEFNNEATTPAIWWGAGLILSGLVSFEFGERLLLKLRF